ncbi:alpha/beta hydrolase [Lophiostoma macrostomum CBS 122681]|uniref:Alpha/beta hydrolase n=1 Tax=Lophiostoma macrostomum CBS 122681 TaxID=1314788 RepID=A0A6A6SRP3_9PLEO|nr:alpha/beta hydrolase [Lophiostoma macrostomum CBS 122681]
MAHRSTLQYTPLPERAQKALEGAVPVDHLVDERVKKFESVIPRPPDKDGDKETIIDVSFTHHVTYTPGDYEVIKWHYVTAGSSSNEAIVFLHGIPDSWFQWHYQMAKLSTEYYCVAVDLKGYGQSETGPGNYLHEAVADQLYVLLQQIGLKQFNIVTHDRGTVQADFIVAKHPEAVLRYGRGEQHLYHYNPVIAPQGPKFQMAPWTGLMEDPKRFVVWVYTFVAGSFPSDEVMARVIQEFSYEGITKAVPRYFNSSTFRQEWICRRERLLGAWKCPVLIMEGRDSKSQPREFYEKSREYVPNAKDVKVRYISGGHFWTLESMEETTQAIRELLEM